MPDILKTVRELKHAPGWKTRERLVVLAVDDYGSVRLADRRARDRLSKHIQGFGGQMDRYDAVETRDDLDALFHVLESARDADGRNAAFTAYALPANPNFGHMRTERSYAYETLVETFDRLSAQQPSAYEGTWNLWQEGMQKGLILPQCHGREHFNVALLEHKLHQRDQDLELNLEVESLAGLSETAEMPGVGFTHAFGLHDESLLKSQKAILVDGFTQFEKVFGFRSRTFTPPALRLHPKLEPVAAREGVESIDKPLKPTRLAGTSRLRKPFNSLSPPGPGKTATIVRNVSFEPGNGKKADPVGRALADIQTAFRWRKPAIISSHRVNYAGHIDPANRKSGLAQLETLLTSIVKKWPDVRFITMDELLDVMMQKRTAN